MHLDRNELFEFGQKGSFHQFLAEVLAGLLRVQKTQNKRPHKVLRITPQIFSGFFNAAGSCCSGLTWPRPDMSSWYWHGWHQLFNFMHLPSDDSLHSNQDGHVAVCCVSVHTYLNTCERTANGRSRRMFHRLSVELSSLRWRNWVERVNVPLNPEWVFVVREDS